jgi:hypothetical protein
MTLRIELTGDVVERQELLNGTQLLTLEGASADGEWTFTGDVAWNRGLVDFAGEGDFTLTRRDGASIFATVTRSQADESDDDAATELTVAYDIDGGEGEYAGAAGTAAASIRIAAGTFEGVWTLQLAQR